VLIFCRNLDAFAEPEEDTVVLSTHHLQINADKVLALDGNAVPTGKFIKVEGTPFDFRNNTDAFTDTWSETVNLCGLGKSTTVHFLMTRLTSMSLGCQGYDACWIYNDPKHKGSKASLWSDKTGIKYV